MILQTCKKAQAKIKIAVQSVSGGGKTYSSLKLAYGMCKDWGKIAVIDTEYQSSNLYADLGPYKVLMLTAPYSPERYVEAIQACELAGMEVIIIDSLSHEWDGDGGILDIHSQMAGNSFTNWSKVTPRHNALVQKILSSQAHIIATVRSKQEYVLTDKNGKSVPEKVGMKGVQRDGLEYDFTLVFELDIKHQAICTKDRTQLFSNKVPFTIDSSTGEKIINWCSEGVITKEVLIPLIQQCKTPAELKKLYDNTASANTYKEEFSKHHATFYNGVAKQ